MCSCSSANAIIQNTQSYGKHSARVPIQGHTFWYSVDTNQLQLLRSKQLGRVLGQILKCPRRGEAQLGDCAAAVRLRSRPGGTNAQSVTHKRMSRAMPCCGPNSGARKAGEDAVRFRVGPQSALTGACVRGVGPTCPRRWIRTFAERAIHLLSNQDTFAQDAVLSPRSVAIGCPCWQHAQSRRRGP